MPERGRCWGKKKGCKIKGEEGLRGGLVKKGGEYRENRGKGVLREDQGEPTNQRGGKRMGGGGRGKKIKR